MIPFCIHCREHKARVFGEWLCINRRCGWYWL